MSKGVELEEKSSDMNWKSDGSVSVLFEPQSMDLRSMFSLMNLIWTTTFHLEFTWLWMWLNIFSLFHSFHLFSLWIDYRVMCVVFKSCFDLVFTGCVFVNFLSCSTFLFCFQPFFEVCEWFGMWFIVLNRALNDLSFHKLSDRIFRSIIIIISIEG